MALLTTGLTFKTMAANVGKAMGKLELLTYTQLVRGRAFIHSFILCDPREDCSMPGLPMLHYLPEFAQVCFLNNAKLLALLCVCSLLDLAPYQDAFD